MTDQRRGLGTEFSDQTADVGGEQVDGVRLEALWLRLQVVATRVGGDYTKTRRRQRRNLSPPTEPELREAVQQNDQIGAGSQKRALRVARARQTARFLASTKPCKRTAVR